MKFKERFRNKGLWLSTAALILLVMQNTGVHIAPEKYNEIVNGVLAVLTALGLFNDPTTGEWYSDK